MSGRPALVVMDFQNGIVAMHESGGSASALAKAAEAIAAFRARKLPVIFVKVAYRPGYPEVSARNKRAAMVKSRGILAEGDGSAELAAGLGVRPEEPVVVKRRVGAFSHTELAALLSASDADTIVLAGLSTSGVVLTTVRQAADDDYNIVVLKDACADADGPVHELLMSKILPAQADVMAVGEYLARL